MNKIVSTGLMSILAAACILASCDKSSQPPDEKNANGADDITLMAGLSLSWMDSVGVDTDEISGDIFMINDGITPDFLIDESYMDPVPGSEDPARVLIRDHSLIRCLKLLALSDTQQVRVGRELHAYKDCKEDAICRVREIYRDLHEKYRIKYKAFLQALKNGRITREEFHRKVEQLKKDFRTELKDLMLKEKLDVALKKCLREFLSGLRGILTGRQWNAFKQCFLH